MLRLRPFKPADGAYLVKWFDNEEMFTKWSAGQFSYPLTRQQVDDYCRKWEEDSNGWPMAVTDETGRVVGHLLMRNMDYQENSLFFGFIVVDPSIRGKGYGKALFKRLAQIAKEREYGRIEWWCLDWNKPSIDFYKSMGAEAMEEWTVYRLSGDTLDKLAE